MSGSVVGDFLGVNLVTAAAAQTAVTATTAAASVLDTTLDAATKGAGHPAPASSTSTAWRRPW